MHKPDETVDFIHHRAPWHEVECSNVVLVSGEECSVFFLGTTGPRSCVFLQLLRSSCWALFLALFWRFFGWTHGFDMAVSILLWCIKPVGARSGPRRWSLKVVPEIRKNVHIQHKTGHLKNSGVVGNSGKTLKIRKNVDIQKSGTFEKIGYKTLNIWPNVKNLDKR